MGNRAAILRSENLVRRQPRPRRWPLFGSGIRRSQRRASRLLPLRLPMGLLAFRCGICRTQDRSWSCVSDRKIVARCADVPGDQIECGRSPDYPAFTTSSVFRGTDSTTDAERAADRKLARLYAYLGSLAPIRPLRLDPDRRYMSVGTADQFTFTASVRTGVMQKKYAPFSSSLANSSNHSTASSSVTLFRLTTKGLMT